MTVLQTVCTSCDPETLSRLRILSGSYVRAVADGDPFAEVRGLDLADLVLRVTDEAALKRDETG
jgi:hypothetical protein